MSVRRLSLDDRNAIAAGMAEGLAFAEIARRLGRPTSTVSREVARNGHRAYVARQAQQALRHPVRKQESSVGATEGDPSARFSNDLASALTTTGMPRMAARIFVALITTQSDAMTAAALVRELGVSAASVSKAVAYLEGMDLVDRSSEPGSRRERYFIADGVWTRAVQADSSGHATVADTARRGSALFGVGSPAGERLSQMSHFFDTVATQLRDHRVDDAVGDDAKTLIAALAHSQRVVTAHQLGSALGWTADRVTAALERLRLRPVLADPFQVRENDRGYSVEPLPDRLSAEQVAALDQPCRAERAGEPDTTN